MNQAAGDRLKRSEAEMARLLQTLMGRVASNPRAAAKLQAAQAAWEAYRSAQLDALWPSDPDAYGSVHPMCQATFAAALTEARINELSEMVTPPEEEACLLPFPE